MLRKPLHLLSQWKERTQSVARYRRLLAQVLPFLQSLYADLRFHVIALAKIIGFCFPKTFVLQDWHLGWWICWHVPLSLQVLFLSRNGYKCKFSSNQICLSRQAPSISSLKAIFNIRVQHSATLQTSLSLHWCSLQIPHILCDFQLFLPTIILNEF